SPLHVGGRSPGARRGRAAGSRCRGDPDCADPPDRTVSLVSFGGTMQTKGRPPLATANLSDEEICQRGEAIYERDLQQVLEPGHAGQFVAIHVANGDYFVAPDDLAALDAAEAKYPGEIFYVGRIGDTDA